MCRSCNVLVIKLLSGHNIKEEGDCYINEKDIIKNNVLL